MKVVIAGVAAGGESWAALGAHKGSHSSCNGLCERSEAISPTRRSAGRKRQGDCFVAQSAPRKDVTELHLGNCWHKGKQMSILPSMRLGLANQWILLLLYAAVLMLSVMRLSKDKRQWLFEDPKEPLRGPRKLLLRIGQVLAIVIIVVMGLTPLFAVPVWLSAIGLATYVAGTAMVVVAIYYFGRAPDSQPVVQGPYRFSRNPQWVGLFLVFLGLAISGGSWLLLVAVFVLGAIYHIQIIEEERACRAKYGRSYEEYVQKVPRYLFFK